MKFYSQERVALFIDGANLYATARSLGFDIDYKRLLDIFRDQCNLVRALYYTALIEDQEYSPIRPLVDWLDYNGYTMVTKPTKEFTDASGRRKVKGNMDIELAIDVMEMLDHLDHIVLFSGDGDFRRLVEAVQRRGRRVTVVSTLRSQPPMIADELRRQADIFIDLAELQSQIARQLPADRSHSGKVLLFTSADPGCSKSRHPTVRSVRAWWPFGRRTAPPFPAFTMRRCRPSARCRRASSSSGLPPASREQTRPAAPSPATLPATCSIRPWSASASRKAAMISDRMTVCGWSTVA